VRLWGHVLPQGPCMLRPDNERWMCNRSQHSQASQRLFAQRRTMDPAHANEMDQANVVCVWLQGVKVRW
jgi:hypothetical protein